MNDRRRITLIARDPRKVERDWDFTNPAGSRIVFVDSLAFLPYAVDRAVRETHYDVERVIVDGIGTALQFLEILSAVPLEFTCDILHINGEGKAFLSSTGRGDGRHLYNLNDGDLAFYLRTNNLTWPEVAQKTRDARSATA